MSHEWMSHVTRMSPYKMLLKESCHACEWVLSSTNGWVMSHMWNCDMTRVWHMWECRVPEYAPCHARHVTQDVTWLSHVTNVGMSCRCVCVMSRTCVSRVKHIIESCNTREWVKSHTCLRHASHVNTSCHTHDWVLRHTWMRHVTHINTSCHTHECVMSHT